MLLTYAGVTFDRCWLLTWTTYGTWLPGERKGFVSSVVVDGKVELHNQTGMPIDADMPALREHALRLLKGKPIYLGTEQASLCLEQFRETAKIRQWQLLGIAIMANHVHLVVGVQDDPDPNKLLHNFKSYASRKLNTHCPRPPSETWWTKDGSKRKLPDLKAIQNAIGYLRRQHAPLAMWFLEDEIV